MPRIINAYADGTGSIADSLKSLGESMFGDQAKNEVFRQKAFSSKRENDNIPLLADAVARGDRDAIARLGVMSNKTGQDAADWNRLGVSNHASGVDDPRLALSMLGAGQAMSATPIGQGRALANDRATTGMNNATSIAVGRGNNETTLESQRIQSDRARDTQLAIDARTLTPVIDDDGTVRYQPKSNATGGRAPMTSDSVIAGVLQAAARNAAPQQGASVAPAGTPQPTGSPADPFASVPPAILKKAGLDIPLTTHVEPLSGRVGTSRDGGRSIILPDGSTVPGTGFLPISSEGGVAQARDNNVRASGAQPLAVPDPTKSQAAADARSTTGLMPAAATIANREVGAIAGPAVIKAATGNPEIAPDVQAARQRQDLRNNEARALLALNPGRQTDEQRRLVNELLPQGVAFGNSATEAHKIEAVVAQLQQDHELYRQQVINPNTPPVDRAKAAGLMRQIEGSIQKFTAPPPAAAQAAPAPAAAAPQGDPLSQARDAIAKGAPREAVIQRLQQSGIDPGGL